MKYIQTTHQTYKAWKMITKLKPFNHYLQTVTGRSETGLVFAVIMKMKITEIIKKNQGRQLQGYCLKTSILYELPKFVIIYSRLLGFFILGTALSAQWQSACLVCRRSWVQFPAESYQRLQKWYSVRPCLAFNIYI